MERMLGYRKGLADTMTSPKQTMRERASGIVKMHHGFLKIKDIPCLETDIESALLAVRREALEERQFVVEQKNRSLKNCLSMALREFHKTKDPNWEHVIRFCKDGGVEPSPLRLEE